jgi:hypothetical protein
MAKSALLVLGCLLLCSFSLHAEGKGRFTTIEEVKSGIVALEDTASAGIISPEKARAGISRYQLQAAALTGKPLSVEEILAYQPPQPHLTKLQKAAGYVTFAGTMWVISILLATLCIAWLFGGWIKALMAFFHKVPLSFWEVTAYVVSVGLIGLGLRLSHTTAPFVGLTGCLLFAVALGFTAKEHSRKITESAWFAALFAVWAVAAVLYNSSLIGFFAIIALMAALGFSVIVSPLRYAIGFEDESAIGRTTASAFGILTIFVVLRIFGVSIPYLSVFERGSLFMGSFVGYLGLLIGSSRWYPNSRKGYGLLQVTTVILGTLALFVGTVWAIPELSKIGGTFFALWMVEKLFEIPVAKKESYAYIGLVVAGLLYGLVMLTRTYPAFFAPYLPF